MSLFSEYTIRGFVVGEVVSALQKAIRRSDMKGAAAWVAELDQSGLGSIAWGRMLVIAAEDVGLASPHLPTTLAALHATWRSFQEKSSISAKQEARLFTMHAALLLASAKKSRIVCDAAWATYGCEEPLVPESPDEALDQHTKRGRQQGRGEQFFKDVASLVSPEVDFGEVGKTFYDRCWDDSGDETWNKYGRKATAGSQAKMRQPEQDSMF